MSSLLSFTSGSSIRKRELPVARPMADPAYGVVGSVVKLNGEASVDVGAVQGKSGADATTTPSSSTITCPTGSFSGVDVGRIIQLGGVDAGSYQIVGITSISSISVLQLNGGGVSFLGGVGQSWSIDDSLTYEWRFVSVPIGSRVVTEGFRKIYPDASLVSFSPDIVGEYSVGLIVSNGVHDSAEVTARVSIRASLVPHGRGLIPDGKFIWSYIRDVWQEVEHKEIFETFWSALVQICGAELLKLYQADFNKSIRDIQDLYQRRWMAYEPKLDLVEADCTFYLGNSCAGSGGTTKNLGLDGQAVILSNKEVIVVLGSVLPDVLGATFSITADSMSSANVGPYPLLGVNLQKTGYRVATSPPTVVGPDPVPGRLISGVQFFFSFQSTTWTLSLVANSFDYALAMSESPLPSDWLVHLLGNVVGTISADMVHAGDVIHYPSGPNVGFYRILSRSGSYFVVDHAPSGASVVGGTLATIYRPVEFELTPAVALPVTSSAFSIPYDSACRVDELAVGRVITIGGQAFTILRTFVDSSQIVTSVIITTDGGVVLVGQVGLNWRVANTLVSTSQNFEELGVTTGDFIEFDITNDNADLTSKVKAQVIGVDRFRLGFVLTTGEVTAGVVPPIPNETYLTLAEDFGVSGVTVNQDGSLTFSGSAAAALKVINSGMFQRTYWNKPLTSSTDINVLKGVFHLHPKLIIRNSRVPVDNDLRSIPVLQDWIVQPTVVQHDTKTFQVKNSFEYEIPRTPVSLVENSDFIVDNEIAFSGVMTFVSGTAQLVVETGHFIERGIKNGDSVEIATLSTLAGIYYVIGVPSNDTLQLNQQIPVYVLGAEVSAQLLIRRRSPGRFVRFLTGGFTASNPAPYRLWAEVSLFDNRPAIEDNFGILVGLTKADLEAVSTDINYRQAVSGLMFAYTRGSTISKIRLGAQILLGLPFAEHRGIIRSLENDYRLDDFGTPILGRLLIEDIDVAGKALGTLRIYTFPVDAVSVLAGVDVNPATGQLYVVGDTVEIFAALCKGVEVVDYLMQAEPSASPVAVLRQFHTTHLRANDSVFSVEEMGLLSDFLKRITPSYVALVISIQAEFVDEVSVFEDTTKKVLCNENDSPIVDQVSLRIPTTPKYDLRTVLGYHPTLWDAGPAWVRVCKTGSLNTTYPTSTATLVAGGFVIPASGEGPIVKPGDTLVIPSGLNSGSYLITVVTDTTLEVSGLPWSGFQTEMQDFFVLRYPTGEIRRGTGNSDGAGTLTVEVGLQADGVAVGDILITEDGYRTTVADVGPHAVTYDGLGVVIPLLAAGVLRVLPVLPSFTGKAYRIYRESFVESPYAVDSGNLHSTGTAYDTFSNKYLQALLDVGDEVQIQDVTLTRLTVLDPVNLVFTPILALGTYVIKVCKRVGDPTSISWDHVAKFAPQDSADISLWETQSLATCTATSPLVSLQEERTLPVISPPVDVDISLVKPGDFLILTSGANSLVDVGYGLGVYPIKIVASPDVTVTTNLTSSDSSAWKILRRR